MDLDKYIVVGVTHAQVAGKAEIIVKTPQGNSIAFNLDSSVYANKKYRFKGKGLITSNGEVGDLYVTCKITDQPINQSVAEATSREKNRTSYDNDKNESRHDVIWATLKVKVYPAQSNRENWFLTDNFYMSADICPYCGRSLYKTVFPPRKEPDIQTRTGTKFMKRVFTCPECQKFFTAALDLLSDGIIYEYHANSKNEYMYMLRYYDSIETTKARPD